MTHKVHPKAYRIKEISDWNTRGYYKEPAEYLEEDFRIREFLRKKIGKFGVEKIEIERAPGKLNIIIFSARPGLIIGRGGEGVERLEKELRQKILKKLPVRISTKLSRGLLAKEGEEKKTPTTTTHLKASRPLFRAREGSAASGAPPEASLASLRREEKKEIRIEIREIKNPWTSASLSAQWAAQQIEKRVHYRRVLKQVLSKITANKEIEGARIEVSGRLNGAEIARRAWVSIGKLPRQTIRADIDYAKAEAHCTYGVVGIKVWIYKGERFAK